MAESDHNPLNLRCSEVWGGNGAIQVPLDLPGLAGWAVSRPYHGDRAGGDVLLMSSCGTGRISRLVLADVSGHGEVVATLASRLRRHMQRYMNHIEPHKLARRLNRDMANLSGDTGRFATGLVMTYFSTDGRFTVCNAGHPPPLLYRHATGEWSVLEQPSEQQRVSNLPLGVLEDSGYVGQQLTLHERDMVLSYTDCFTEASHPNEGMLMTAGLLQHVRELGPGPAEDAPPVFLEALLERLTAQGYAWDDDLTMAVWRCTGRSEGRNTKQVLDGLWRTVKMPFNHMPFPWPEVSWDNLGGAIFRSPEKAKPAES